MADLAAKSSPLAHLPERADAPDAPVRLAPGAPRGRLNLRGDAGDTAFLAAVADALGAEPPTAANTAVRASRAVILWLGPDEWLVETDPEAEAETAAALEGAFGALHAAVTVVGDATTTLSLAGPRAPDVLAKGMTLDLDPARFGPGQCARSLLAKSGVLLHRPDDALAYEITVGRSFADYTWRWLADAALEYAAGGEG